MPNETYTIRRSVIFIINLVERTLRDKEAASTLARTHGIAKGLVESVLNMTKAEPDEVIRIWRARTDIIGHIVSIVCLSGNALDIFPYSPSSVRPYTALSLIDGHARAALAILDKISPACMSSPPWTGNRATYTESPVDPERLRSLTQQTPPIPLKGVSHADAMAAARDCHPRHIGA